MGGRGEYQSDRDVSRGPGLGHRGGEHRTAEHATRSLGESKRRGYIRPKASDGKVDDGEDPQQSGARFGPDGSRSETISERTVYFCNHSFYNFYTVLLSDASLCLIYRIIIDQGKS